MSRTRPLRMLCLLCTQLSLILSSSWTLSDEPPVESRAKGLLNSPDDVFGPAETTGGLHWRAVAPTTPLEETRSSHQGVTTAEGTVDSRPRQQSAVQQTGLQLINNSGKLEPVTDGQRTSPSQSSDVKQASPPAITAETKTAHVELEPDSPTTLTLEEIERKQSAIAAQTDIPEEIRTQVAEHYRRAAESVRLVTDSAKKTAEMKAERDQGPELIKSIRLSLESPPENSAPRFEEGQSISHLEQARLAEEELANLNRKELEGWEQRAKLRTERKPQLPALIDKVKQQIVAVQKTLEAPAVEGEVPALTQARISEQQSHLMLLQQQLEQYRIEQSTYEALTDLYPLRRDLMMRKKAAIEKRLEKWKTLISQARQLESQRQAEEAKNKLRLTHPALRELAERNTELTEKRKTLQADLYQTNEDLEQTNGQLETLARELQDLVDKEELGALTTGAGMLLRNQRKKLPSRGKYRDQRRFATRTISEIQLELMPLKDERDELADLESQLDSILLTLQAQRTLSDDEIREMARDLLNDRRKYLDDLLGDYSSYLTALGELDVSSRRLVATIEETENFIDERILWIPSAGPISTATLPRVWQGTQSLVSTENLKSVTTILVSDVAQHRYLWLFALFASISILGLSRRIRLLIIRLGLKQNRRVGKNLASTMTAIALTILVSSVWPTLIWLIGWRISSVAVDDFTFAFGNALEVTALTFWSMEVLRQFSKKKGIAEAYLEWHPQIMAMVHSRLSLLMIASLPLMFLTVISDVYHDGYWADSVGRISFIAFCGILLAVSVRLLNPTGNILGTLLKQNQDGVMFRTRYVWYSLSLFAPTALILLSLYGYQYTAEQLLIRLQFTLWLSISLLIAYTLVTQWVVAVRKQIALDQAHQRRAKLLMKEQHETGSPVPPVEVPEIDFAAVNLQVRKLLRVVACVILVSGCWTIWSQVMPALQIVQRVELWSTLTNVVESVDMGDGTETLRSVPKREWITLGDLLFSMATIVVAFLASKNLPGFLELALLKRLPLDHGERNAVTTLCRYACILFGVIVGARTIGIGWSSVQWLVAALTVGLGFGLQEIFANFVSGLIILFERPIRIGDVVTIDSVTGSVSKIQIRATTIIDWDRKEYIVPNKEFVTGRLLNWTLSDKTNRVVINVGVAYGADTDKALKILDRIAIEHPVVLNDPAPIASFEGFGDSSLSFNLRVYLPNLDNRLRVITELHMTIDREFRKAGLEIAFPQMDLHIRSGLQTPSHLSVPQSEQGETDLKAA